MSPNMFMFLLTVVSSTIGTALSYGIVPASYVGIATGLSVMVAGLVRPPAKKT